MEKNVPDKEIGPRHWGGENRINCSEISFIQVVDLIEQLHGIRLPIQVKPLSSSS